jgi:hypothetical protein
LIPFWVIQICILLGMIGILSLSLSALASWNDDRLRDVVDDQLDNVTVGDANNTINVYVSSDSRCTLTKAFSA